MAVTALLFGSASPAWAGGDDRPEEGVPFDEAKLYFELNDTDGDLGIHGLVDGDDWKRLEIVNHGNIQLLDVFVRGRLRRQGMTEIFFESAEPPFDELAPEMFFRRFPEGTYAIRGITLEGEKLESKVELSQVMAAPPQNITLSGTPAAENCDSAQLPVLSDPVVIDWDAVTTSHPEIGRAGAMEIERYQLVVEREEPTLLVFSVDLPPDTTSLQIPSDFLALGDEFKFEIVVRAVNGNQTAVESCFQVQ